MTNRRTALDCGPSKFTRSPQVFEPCLRYGPNIGR